MVDVTRKTYYSLVAHQRIVGFSCYSYMKLQIRTVICYCHYHQTIRVQLGQCRMPLLLQAKYLQCGHIPSKVILPSDGKLPQARKTFAFVMKRQMPSEGLIAFRSITYLPFDQGANALSIPLDALKYSQSIVVSRILFFLDQGLRRLKEN